MPFGPPGPALGGAQSDPAISELIGKCHDAVLKAAKPYGAARVAFSYAGPPPTTDEAIGPIVVTAIYLRQGGEEVRRASIRCRLDDMGYVIALM